MFGFEPKSFPPEQSVDNCYPRCRPYDISVSPRNWTGILSLGKLSPARLMSSSMLFPKEARPSSPERSLFFPSLGWIPWKVWPGMTPEPWPVGLLGKLICCPLRRFSAAVAAAAAAATSSLRK